MKRSYVKFCEQERGNVRAMEVIYSHSIQSYLLVRIITCTECVTKRAKFNLDKTEKIFVDVFDVLLCSTDDSHHHFVPDILVLVMLALPNNYFIYNYSSSVA